MQTKRRVWHQVLLRRSVPVVFAAVSLSVPAGAYASELFLPQADATSLNSTADGRAEGAPVGSWERRAGINRHGLIAARNDVENAGTGTLLLNVKDGVQLDVAVERTAATRRGYSLSGRVVGKNAGFVTLVVHGDAVAGSIWTPDSVYEISHIGGGTHALRDTTNAAPFECGGVLPSNLSAADQTAHQELPLVNPFQDGTDDSSVVDILVVWTPEAEEKHIGPLGEAQMLLRIDMMVAYANDALQRSGALVTFNLVGAEKVDYTETRWGIDLVRLERPDDGHMDRVHDLRDDLGADLVYLVSRVDAGLNGGAFSLGAPNGGTLAHEFGHAFGIAHERYQAGTRAYYHGFTTNDCDQTIMSYGHECRHRLRVELPFFATPWRYGPSDGSALGVNRFSKQRGVRGPADAVLTLNRNRHRIANLRPSHGGY